MPSAPSFETHPKGCGATQLLASWAVTSHPFVAIGAITRATIANTILWACASSNKKYTERPSSFRTTKLTYRANYISCMLSSFSVHLVGCSCAAHFDWMESHIVLQPLHPHLVCQMRMLYLYVHVRPTKKKNNWIQPQSSVLWPKRSVHNSILHIPTCVL